MPSTLNAKALAKKGQDLLEEAVLEVLEVANEKGICMGPKEISDQAGIFRLHGGGGDLPISMNDAIVQGIIIKLYKAKRVVGCNPPGRGTKGYKLSASELASRKNSKADAQT